MTENNPGTFVLEQSMRPPVKKSLLPFNNISCHNAFINQNTYKNSIKKKNAKELLKSTGKKPSSYALNTWLAYIVRNVSLNLDLLVKVDKVAIFFFSLQAIMVAQHYIFVNNLITQE